jgi:hypothetical protein
MECEYLDFPKFCERLLAKITEHDGFRSESALRRDFRNNQKTIFDFDNAIRQLTAEGRIQAGRARVNADPRLRAGNASSEFKL